LAGMICYQMPGTSRAVLRS